MSIYVFGVVEVLRVFVMLVLLGDLVQLILECL